MIFVSLLCHWLICVFSISSTFVSNLVFVFSDDQVLKYYESILKDGSSAASTLVPVTTILHKPFMHSIMGYILIFSYIPLAFNWHHIDNAFKVNIVIYLSFFTNLQYWQNKRMFGLLVMKSELLWGIIQSLRSTLAFNWYEEKDRLNPRICVHVHVCFWLTAWMV